MAKRIGSELSAIQMKGGCSNFFSPIIINAGYLLLSEFTKYILTARFLGSLSLTLEILFLFRNCTQLLFGYDLSHSQCFQCLALSHFHVVHKCLMLLIPLFSLDALLWGQCKGDLKKKSKKPQTKTNNTKRPTINQQRKKPHQNTF